MRFLLALLLGAAGAASASDLEGKVVEDHSGNALASVEVRVYKTGQRTLAADLETDSAGRFSAAGLPAGEYRIEASKANFIGATLRMQGVATGLVIRLVRCGVIAGQVMDAQGQPILGASVYAMPKPAAGEPLRPFNTLGQGNFTRVDERGQYRLHGLPPGEYAVAASYGASTSTFGSTGGASVRPGLGSGVQIYPRNDRPQFFPVTGGEQYRNIDFSIVPTNLHNLSGRVDLPEPKTRYWLALIAADQPAVAVAVADTKPDGSFRFEGVPAGAYTLSAAGPTRGYGGKALLGPEPYFGRTQVSIAGDVENVVVSLQRGRAVSFILRSAGGQQAEGGCPANAQLALTALDDFAAMIDRTGEISVAKEQTIANLAPARYRVGAGKLGELCYQTSNQVIDLSAGVPESPVPVLVASAGAIHGKLSGALKPSDIAVALLGMDAGSGETVQVVFPGADGRFTFGGLRPGRYRIVASKERWITEASRMIEIQIAGGAPTEMELPVGH